MKRLKLTFFIKLRFDAMRSTNPRFILKFSVCLGIMPTLYFFRAVGNCQLHYVTNFDNIFVWLYIFIVSG